MTIKKGFRADGGDIGTGRLKEIADNPYGDEEKCWLARRVLALLDELEAMTPEQRADHDAGMNEFASMLQSNCSIKPVADLYEVTVPSGRSTTFTTDATEAKDCADLGWKVQEYVTLERYQAAMLQGDEPVQEQNQSAGYAKKFRSIEKVQVLQTGWVAVPVEPTESMIIAGFEAELREEFRKPDAWEAFEAMSGCEQAAHRAKLCWAAMIAAVPQQETKV